MNANLQLPQAAEVVERVQESPIIFTLRLRLRDPELQEAYRFEPGQFNMLYLYGVGEVPISIVSDPKDHSLLDHTIRVVGRVTRGLSALRAGDWVGVRGPFGRGWPLERAEGRDLVLVTGGLGCAPMVSVVRYIVRRRERFGHITLIQGVKHSADLIWREQYAQWAAMPDLRVLLAADHASADWPWHVGRVTELLEDTTIDPGRTLSMLCGPEVMMQLCADHLLGRGLADDRIWLSMERNMQCGLGRCGHCQHGSRFVCHQGPVFAYRDVRDRLGVRGF